MTRQAIFAAVREAAPDVFDKPGHIALLDAVCAVFGIGTEDGSEPTGFERALAVILQHEGGYVNHPDDPGGRTNLGVTQRVWEAWTGQRATEAAMRALTPPVVAPLYEQNYWQASGANQLPAGLALCVFDFAVNAGAGRAVEILQEVVGATPDRVFGPQTLAEVLKDVRDVGEAEIIRQYQAARERYYRTRKKFPIFGKGWLRRNGETLEKALELAS